MPTATRSSHSRIVGGTQLRAAGTALIIRPAAQNANSTSQLPSVRRTQRTAVTAAPAGILGQIVPVGALLFGWAFLGEQIAGLSLAGAAITLAGVSFSAWRAGLLTERAVRRSVLEDLEPDVAHRDEHQKT